jgi:hypothetical protein
MLEISNASARAQHVVASLHTLRADFASDIATTIANNRVQLVASLNATGNAMVSEFSGMLDAKLHAADEKATNVIERVKNTAEQTVGSAMDRFTPNPKLTSFLTNAARLVAIRQAVVLVSSKLWKADQFLCAGRFPASKEVHRDMSLYSPTFLGKMAGWAAVLVGAPRSASMVKMLTSDAADIMRQVYDMVSNNTLDVTQFTKFVPASDDDPCLDEETEGDSEEPGGIMEIWDKVEKITDKFSEDLKRKYGRDLLIAFATLVLGGFLLYFFSGKRKRSFKQSLECCLGVNEPVSNELMKAGSLRVTAVDKTGVCRVNSKLGTGTAFHVRNYLVTALHCVQETGLLAGPFDSDAKVVFEYNGKSVSTKFLRGCRTRDYAVFEYDSSLDMGIYKLARPSSSDQFPGTVIGYDNGGMQVMQSNGMIRISGDDIKHFCSTTNGVSGGPIFDGNAKVVGMHQAGAYSGNLGIVITDALLDGNTVCTCDVCQYSESKRKRRGNAASNGRVNAMDHPEEEKKKNKEKPQDPTEVKQVRPPLEIPAEWDSDSDDYLYDSDYDQDFIVWGDDDWEARGLTWQQTVAQWWSAWAEWLSEVSQTDPTIVIMNSEVSGDAMRRRHRHIADFSVNQRSL